MYSIIERKAPDLRSELIHRGLLKPDERLVFWLGNCALVESFCSCRYSYRALQLKNGESKWLFSVKRQLPRARFDSAADKIMSLPFYENSEIPSREERGKALLERIFKEILPQHGFVYREKQLELACTMFSAMCNKQAALCEAGVGSGKTLAYLLASTVYKLLHDEKKPVVISTSTIALQKALTEEYIPQLSDILLKHSVIVDPIEYVIRKGKTHYACDLRLKGYRASIENLDKEPELLQQLNDLWAAPKEAIDLSLYPLSRYVKDCVCVPSRCPQKCMFENTCRYHKYVAECMEHPADFQVTNHNYVFAHLLHGKQGKRDMLPPHHAVVFDEAHKLLDAARQIYGVSLHIHEIALLVEEYPLNKIPSPHEKKVVGAWLELLGLRNSMIFQHLAPKQSIQKDGTRQPVAISEVVQLSLQRMKQDLEHLLVLSHDHGNGQMNSYLPMLKIRCRDICEKLDYFMDSAKLILWLETGADGPCLSGIPRDLEKRLYYDLWGHQKPYILTSGTMSVSGDFFYFQKRVGLHLIDEQCKQTISLPSPFNYKENTLLYIPESIPFPDVRNPAYTKAVAEEIKRLVDATHGHTLVLFTSYRVMERVYNMTKDYIRARYPLYMLKRGRVDVLANFKRSGNGVLFASDAAGEGVDLAGDILSSLIIVKLPFAVPDAISEYERKQYGSLQAYQQAVTVPNMLIKLKQYVGRAIRTETDTAVISILDKRVSKTAKYRETVLNQLDCTAVAHELREVEGFIHSKKSVMYF